MVVKLKACSLTLKTVFTSVGSKLSLSTENCSASAPFLQVGWRCFLMADLFSSDTGGEWTSSFTSKTTLLVWIVTV